jgi:NAD+ synthase (glutamine-hydrolysing)
MKIALCQINPIIGDFAYNTSLILEGCEKARTSGCALAVFPELSLMGYPPKDLLERPAFIRENLGQLDKLSRKIKAIHIICGYVDRNPQAVGKPLINAVALLGEGRILSRGGKRCLPTYDVFDETRYFEPAEKSLVFALRGRRIGVSVCEDIWTVGDIEGVPRYPFDPVSEMAAQGIDLLVNVSASPFTINKKVLRRQILQKLSKQYGVPILYCNQVGGNDDILFDGAGMVSDKTGHVVLMGKEFEADFLVWDDAVSYDPVEPPSLQEEVSILKGLVMGTKDYVTKCGFGKVLIGLSGGIDSALVAVIAREALGEKNVTGVGMPSLYTSAMSCEDARTLAENLGIEFHEIPITAIFESFTQSLSPLFRGLEPDETEENIQARIRGTLLMALSNKFGAILLSTGNKSETAVGYSTLYGDMNGGLAVISDVPKTMVYRLARHINREREIIPARVLSRPPSAELRAGQTDQDSLPPYELLDQILDLAVVGNLGFEEIVARGFEPAVVKDVLRRIVLNEYKRRQAPPGLKVTTKAFGYGRRYPLARGKQPY